MDDLTIKREKEQRIRWAKLLREGAVTVRSLTFGGGCKPLSVESSEKLALYLQESGYQINYFPPSADL